MLVAKVSGGEFRNLLFAVVSNRSGLILLVLDGPESSCIVS